MASRWDRFWFFEGEQWTAAVTRIGIAVSVLWVLADAYVADYAAFIAGQPVDLYAPDGLLMLLGPSVPAPWLLGALQAIALVSTIGMLLGAFSRAATAVSLVSSLLVVSFQFSFVRGWSHGYNAVFLAQLAFVFARGGDRLSVDALWRRLRGREPITVPGGYAWSVRLVAFALAFMFANAAYWKFKAGGLDWALSDNLRHQILVRYDWLNGERTALADWLLQSPWRYQSAALLNLIGQLAPLLAFFLFKRPLWRAVLGLTFAIETVALGLVMDLWFLQWLPLSVVFIDWDWLVARLRRAPAEAPREAPLSSATRRIATALIAVFITFNLAVGVIPKLDVTARPYPFTRFPMFSKVRAEPPYSEHRPYTFAGSRIEVVSDAPITEALENYLVRNRAFRWIERDRPSVQEKKLRQLWKRVSRDRDQRKTGGPQALRIHAVLFRAPPYPEPAALEVHRIGILSELDSAGRFRSLAGSIERPSEGQLAFQLRPIGFAEPPAIESLSLYVDRDPTPQPVTAVEQTGNRGVIAVPDGRSYVLVANLVSDGETLPFFVGQYPPGPQSGL